LVFRSQLLFPFFYLVVILAYFYPNKIVTEKYIRLLLYIFDPGEKNSQLWTNRPQQLRRLDPQPGR
jgi:hypothetical protein